MAEEDFQINADFNVPSFHKNYSVLVKQKKFTSKTSKAHYRFHLYIR